MKNHPSEPSRRATFCLARCLILCWLALLATGAHAATILVVGDSLSAGFGIRQEDAWPSLLQKRLHNSRSTAIRKHRVINASISGETTAGGRSRLAGLLGQHRPQIVIVELGANDGLRGLSLNTMRDNLTGMLTQIRQTGARAILVGMRLPPNYGAYAIDFGQHFTTIAQQTKTPLVPFLLDRLEQGPTHFLADGLHPTREAQPIILDNIWPALQPMLASADAITAR